MSTNMYSHTLEDRVRTVSELVRQSVASWMEIAKHVRAAKLELTEIDYETFIERTGLTGSICDKLVRVARCEKLYEDDLKKHTSRLEGWTNLYELTKLNNLELDEFVGFLNKDQTVPVTRGLIQSFKSGGSKTGSSSKESIVAKIVFSHDELARLDLVEFDKLKILIDEISRKIDAASPAISIKIIDSVIAQFEALLSAEEFDGSQNDHHESMIDHEHPSEIFIPLDEQAQILTI